MGFYHPPQPANTGTAAQRVNNASCLYIANKQKTTIKFFSVNDMDLLHRMFAD
jgi:hypothetical protein